MTSYWNMSISYYSFNARFDNLANSKFIARCILFYYFFYHYFHCITLRDENDIKLRIAMLQAQSKTLAETFTKALVKKNNDINKSAIQEYSSKLVNFRDKIEELLWVLDQKDKSDYSYLKFEVHQITLPFSKKKEDLTIEQIIDKLRSGELSMDDLPTDVSKRVRKAIVEKLG
jgi:hypothetical protein